MSYDPHLDMLRQIAQTLAQICGKLDALESQNDMMTAAEVCDKYKVSRATLRKRYASAEIARGRYSRAKIEAENKKTKAQKRIEASAAAEIKKRAKK